MSFFPFSCSPVEWPYNSFVPANQVKVVDDLGDTEGAKVVFSVQNTNGFTVDYFFKIASRFGHCPNFPIPQNEMYFELEAHRRVRNFSAYTLLPLLSYCFAVIKVAPICVCCELCVVKPRSTLRT
jgi:hypothetical protein